MSQNGATIMMMVRFIASGTSMVGTKSGISTTTIPAGNITVAGSF